MVESWKKTWHLNHNWTIRTKSVPYVYHLVCSMIGSQYLLSIVQHQSLEERRTPSLHPKLNSASCLCVFAAAGRYVQVVYNLAVVISTYCLVHVRETSNSTLRDFKQPSSQRSHTNISWRLKATLNETYPPYCNWIPYKHRHLKHHTQEAEQFLSTRVAQGTK